MKINFFDKKLNKTAKDLNFSIKAPNENLILHALRVLFFNERKARAVTKTKAEVRGGGKKPWRQKGTGRARTGSTRNPHWVGGGVSHGPRNINWTLSISKVMGKKAFVSAVFLKASQKQIDIVDFPELKSPKCKEVKQIFNTVLADDAKKTILLITNNDEFLLKSVRNLKNVKSASSSEVNTKDIVTANRIIITQNALSKFEERVK